MTNSMSPYEATQTVLGEQNYKVEPASKWLRLLNLLIDYIAFWVLGLVVGMVIIVEGATGRTLGKLVTGTRVVNAAGGTPSFKQILGRSLARFIPFEAFSFLGDDGRGWHDSIPDTYVIRCR